MVTQPAVAQTKKPEKAAKKSAKKPAEDERPKIDVEQLRRDLDSGDEAKIIAALETAKTAEAQAAEVGGICDGVLRRGATVKVSLKAFETAGALKQEASSAAVAPYVRHRDAELRRAATRTLLKTRGSEAVRALRLALRSPDASVRDAAASGLGELGAKEAIPDLFQALDHNVAAAASAIGQMCSPDQCGELASRVGKLPFSIMMTGLEQVLFRPAPEVSDDYKVELIGRLRELGTPEARRFMQEVSERWPEDGSAKVRQALEAAVRSGGSSGGKSQ
jgi:HEAT repeat protein